MAPLSARLATTATVVWLLGAAVARADFQDWSYNWSQSPVAIPANGGSASGAVNFTLPQIGPSNSPINPVALTASTSTNSTDQFNNATWSLTFSITDPNASTSHDVTVSGEFNGSMTQNLVTLANTFLNGSGSQSFDFLGHHWVVTFGFTSPSGPTAPTNWTGDVTASVVVSDIPVTGPPPATSPEPASLLLAGIACPALGLMAWIRRLRKPARRAAV